MQIQTCQYADAEHSAVIINDALSVPWPCRTGHREFIQAWLDTGNTPAEARQAPEKPTAAERAEDEIARSPALLAIIGWIAAEKGVTEEAVIRGMQTKLGALGPKAS